MIRSEILGKNLLAREWTAPAPTPRGEALILHGLGDHTGRHDWAAGFLTRAGYRTVGFDWPGCGGSDGIRGDIPTVKESAWLIEEMLAALDLSPRGIFAHSTGAFLVLHWLVQCLPEHPALSSLRWIWLSSPLLRPSHGQPRLKIALATALARRFPGLTLNTGVHARDCFHTGRDPSVEAALVRLGVHHRVSLRFATSLMAEEPVIVPAVGAIPGRIAFLLTQGSEDGVCPPVYAETLFAALPVEEKTWVYVSGARHEPFREIQSEGINLAVRSWLGRLDGEALSS